MNSKGASQKLKYRMNVSRIAVLVLALAGLCACAAKNYQGQRGPICLGPVCLDRDTWKDAAPFFEEYGVGVEGGGKFPAYWYEEKGSFIYIGRYHGENKPINTIVVSKYPYHSEEALPPNQPFGVLATEKGIRLGASYAQVVAAYGEPDKLYTHADGLEETIPETWTSVSSEDIIIARYANAPGKLWSLFYFEKDVLIAIELSNAV